MSSSVKKCGQVLCKDLPLPDRQPLDGKDEYCKRCWRHELIGTDHLGYESVIIGLQSNHLHYEKG